VGTLVGERQGVATQQVVTTACHHCADPACANGCPTLAYEKDASTGIVRHLDDQCMGCRYCELKCPYEVPKYNDRLGIVRKCDMCQSRLAEGEAPACVQACPNQAIRIRIVPVQASTPSEPLLPGTVDSSYTRPTTVYTHLDTDAKPMPADAKRLSPAHGHFPLVWMLVMVPISVGMSTAVWLGGSTDRMTLMISVILGCLGLTGSVLHLGRPSQAWRAVLGWRRSWLSREIIVFNLWIGALTGFLGAVWLGLPATVTQLLGIGSVTLGVAGLVASAMVYADTQRPFWRFSSTFTRFVATACCAGFLVSPIPWLAILPLVFLLGMEASIVFEPETTDQRPSALMRGPLRTTTSLRFLVALALVVAASAELRTPWIALSLLAITELCARSLFFRAVDEPKMPGIG
jgi:Fe-S-cluster-containing dehydrogenase component/DMSO reductase anchor subunit